MHERIIATGKTKFCSVDSVLAYISTSVFKWKKTTEQLTVVYFLKLSQIYIMKRGMTILLSNRIDWPLETYAVSQILNNWLKNIYLLPRKSNKFTWFVNIIT